MTIKRKKQHKKRIKKQQHQHNIYIDTIEHDIMAIMQSVPLDGNYYDNVLSKIGETNLGDSIDHLPFYISVEMASYAASIDDIIAQFNDNWMMPPQRPSMGETEEQMLMAFNHQFHMTICFLLRGWSFGRMQQAITELIKE